MRSLFWRIFFSLMTLIVALVLVTFLIDATTHSGGPGPRFGLHPLQLNQPPHRADGIPASHPGPPPDINALNGSPPSGPQPGYTPPRDPDGGPPGHLPPPLSSIGGFDDHHPPHSAFDVLRVYQEQGQAGVNRYFRQLRGQTGTQFYLFDGAVHQLAGVIPDQAIRSLAARAARSGHLEVDASSAVVMHADILHSGSQSFILADATYPRPMDFAVAALRIVSIVLIAALVCWWLTRQITKPIVLLRGASQDLAAGRFQTRVKPLLAGRNDEIGSLADDFDTMAQRLDTLMTAQNRLLADVSHELRSPIARLSVATALARREEGEQTSKYLDRIEREAARLNELIGQLTLVSRLEMETSSPDDGPVNLCMVVQHVCDDGQYEAQALDKTVACKIEAPDGEPIMVSGNAALLRSAVENIVRNAVRSTNPGTAVEVGLTSVARGNKRMAAVMVRDHGPGVPPHELESIFKPFYRTAEARDRDSGGVGLGLAIAQRAVLRHGGAVQAENSPNGGLLVTIELPL